VRQIFKISRIGNVAGCFVLDGTLHRNDLIRVRRGTEVLTEGAHVSALRRFTDDVREVQSGYECGISIEGFNNLQEGDVIEFYHRERIN
jgi:translation initiation factor IF-2